MMNAYNTFLRASYTVYFALFCFVFAGTGDQPDQLYAQSCFGTVFSNESCRKRYSKVEAKFYSGKRSFHFLCYGESLIRNLLKLECGQGGGSLTMLQVIIFWYFFHNVFVFML